MARKTTKFNGNAASTDDSALGEFRKVRRERVQHGVAGLAMLHHHTSSVNLIVIRVGAAPLTKINPPVAEADAAEWEFCERSMRDDATDKTYKQIGQA